MNRQFMDITKIQPLEDGQNGEKRYSLREGKEGFCVAVFGKDESLDVKVGDRVLAVQRDITLQDGTKATQWYYSQVVNDVDAWATKQASKDANILVEEKKATRLAQVKKVAESFKLDPADAV